MSQTQAAVGVGHLGGPVARTPACHSFCWQTPCTFLETTTSRNGHHSSDITPHLHFVPWEPPLLIALELQVSAPSKPTWGSPYKYFVYQLFTTDPTGAGSGVPFHWHGPGFSEVIFGRKVSTRVEDEFGVCSSQHTRVTLYSCLQRWFLYPPEKTPEFHPNKTTLAWLLEIYPSLAPSARPLECTIQAGEVSSW